MAARKKIAFTTQGTDADGVEAEVELAVKQPSAAVRSAADLYGKKRYAEAVRQNCLLMAHVDSHLRENRLWNDRDEESFKRAATAPCPTRRPATPPWSSATPAKPAST